MTVSIKTAKRLVAFWAIAYHTDGKNLKQIWDYYTYYLTIHNFPQKLVAEWIGECEAWEEEIKKSNPSKFQKLTAQIEKFATKA